MSTMDGIEASAKSLLKRAVELDTAQRFTEALVCYQEGTYLLLDVLKANKDSGKREIYRKKIEEYIDRSEKLKDLVRQRKEEGKYHEQIKIEVDSIGHSYEQILKPFIDADLTAVVIEDPYIRTHHQILNLVRFCEVFVIFAKNIKRIQLLTSPEPNDRSHKEQCTKLNDLKESLKNYGIQLTVEYSNSLHDREIRFDNGWVIKIGRGLDYFKPSDSKFSIGIGDYKLRRCHETVIDIFHQKHMKK